MGHAAPSARTRIVNKIFISSGGRRGAKAHSSSCKEAGTARQRTVSASQTLLPDIVQATVDVFSEQLSTAERNIAVTWRDRLRIDELAQGEMLKDHLDRAGIATLMQVRNPRDVQVTRNGGRPVG